MLPMADILSDGAWTDFLTPQRYAKTSADQTATGPPQHNGIAVNNDPLELECDRLSNTVDSFLFERIRWDRVEGPLLARLAELSRAAFESRPDFELAEEGATSDLKRFVLKVHSNRIMAIKMWLANGRALIDVEAIERSQYKVIPAEPISIEFGGVDEQWMAASMRALLARVRSPEGM